MKRINKLVTFVVFLLISSPLLALGQPERYDVPIGKSLQKGPEAASVTIIEFLDFQ